MSGYTVNAWGTDDVLARANSLREARAKARRLLKVSRTVHAEQQSLPSGAMEGYHASHVEGCASVLIYRV